MATTPNGAYTYTSIGDWCCARAFTTHDAASICLEFAQRLGPGHVIIPEAIREGGLLWLEWPGKQAGQYKTARFAVGGPMGNWQWPRIQHPDRADRVQDWLAAPPVAISPEYGVESGAFFLKAFYGAPVWTLAELQHLEDAVKTRPDVDCRILPELVSHRDPSLGRPAT
jgi:hypothetical protein